MIGLPSRVPRGFKGEWIADERVSLNDSIDDDGAVWTASSAGERETTTSDRTTRRAVASLSTGRGVVEGRDDVVKVEKANW